MWVVRAEPGMDGTVSAFDATIYAIVIQGSERKAAIVHHPLVSSPHLARPRP